MSIEILNVTCFPDTISAGVTMVNKEAFPPHGLTISGHLLLPHEIARHRDALRQETKADKIAFQKQVHGTGIVYVDNEYMESESDGLITNIPGQYICVSLADCCGILIYDPDHNAIGAFHSGWRGTKAGMPIRAVRKMSMQFNSRPAGLTVYLAPCASQKKYEVGPEFANFFHEFVRRDQYGKYYYDNKACIIHQLQMADIKTEHIYDSGICNISDERFHSFRRDGDKSGRMGAFIGIKK